LDDRTTINLANWNERVAVHVNSAGYRLDDFRKGEIHLYPLEREEVGDVRGKSLLHLQCHFGIDTMSWARMGATVTGLDFSDQAIEAARKLSTELKIPATFVCSNIYDAPDALDRQFDIVFTSYGALCWLPDLKRWAQIAAPFVKPGGFFYIAEFHPMTQVMANGGGVAHAGAAEKLEFEFSYFSTAMREFPPGRGYQTLMNEALRSYMFTNLTTHRAASAESNRRAREEIAKCQTVELRNHQARNGQIRSAKKSHAPHAHL
jgi:2-polyprenyl-3-methyl-5-hydroxy-6-metoxy-1,4-benzoquinol methylase